MPQNDKQKDIGAVWVRKTSKGEKFLGISVEIEGTKYSLVGFRNSFKKEDKHPDFRLYVSENSNGGGSTAPAKTYAKPYVKRAPAPPPADESLLDD